MENDRDRVQQELDEMHGFGLEFHTMTKCNQLERFLHFANMQIDLQSQPINLSL